MMKKIIFLFYLLISSLSPVCAQHHIQGIVMDKSTHEVLPFVNIVALNGKVGTSTDIEGKFSLNSTIKIEQITLSYIGYETLKYTITDGEKQIVYLNKKVVELAEAYIYPGINPADVLMEKVISNKKINNPEKNINFKYNSYNKLFITMAIDSSLLSHPEKIAQMDSSDQEAIRFFEKQYLFLAESVTERNYKLPDKNSEVILASKISGFENPIFNLLATELQSFTFYRDYISLAGINYEGPLTNNATKRYFFLLEDTLYYEKDTVFILSFRPKKDKDFKGMKGTLGISTNAYALQTVIAEPAKLDTNGIGIKINQRYEYIDGQQWFPVQLNTILYFHSIKINNFKAIGIANGYLKNIQINPELKNKDFGSVEVKIDDNIAKQDETFWQTYRQDSLSEVEKNTYISIDSISKANKLEKKINTFSYLLEGQIPVGPIGIDIGRLFSFNDYEGLRLGLGLHTNDKISKYVSLGGYFAYGFRDKAFKYGGDLLFQLPKKLCGIKFSASHDIIEAGGADYLQTQSQLFLSDISKLYITRFDHVDRGDIQLYFRFAKHFKASLFGNIQFRKSFENYTFQKIIGEGITYGVDEYSLAEYGSVIRFQFKEKFIETNKKLISKGSEYPVLLFKITKGMIGESYGDFNYLKLETRLEKKHRIRGFGYFTYILDAGYTKDKIPYGILFNPRGTWRSLKTGINVVSGNGFEVMRTNEFFMDQYCSYHFRFDFKSFFKKGKFKPELGLVSSGLWGKNAQTDQHLGHLSIVPEKGYYESGLLINQLIRSGFSGFGIGVFYRYGPYQLDKGIDNFAFKLSLSISLF